MAIFGREIILFSAKGRESQRSLRVSRRRRVLIETARVVKNREHGLESLDSGVSAGNLSRQIIKVVRSSGLECRRSQEICDL